VPNGHTYLCCRKAAKARFDNRQRLQRTRPYPRTASAAAAQAVQAIPGPTTMSPTAPIPRDQHRQICTYPPRAKGFLNRRFEWFSLVTFFLQKKKVTRAEARNAPSRARRQCPPNIPAALAATYPLRCFAPQWARFDNRQKRPAHQPLPSLLSAAAAQEVQAIPRTDNDPHRTNSAKPAPPNLHLPAPRQGVLRP
jgi:hypothetical protein